ncbi:hypothetical protein J7K41_04130 [Candidatus Micrarchaeota archaeon]|nr:hypothetical protein [Candidatus Micrarchaeota archaeon]
MPNIAPPQIPRVAEVKPTQIKAAREEFGKLKRHLNEVPSWELTSMTPVELKFGREVIEKVGEDVGRTVLETLERIGK